jgi:hypothetical protein
MGNDLNPAGVVGDASAAQARDGQAIIAHQAAQMVKLLGEVERFTPDWFAGGSVDGRPAKGSGCLPMNNVAPMLIR